MSKIISLLKNILNKKFGIFITHVNPQFKEDIFHRVLTLHTHILHIGANRGQEALYYDSLNLNVLWVEADPQVETELSKHIEKFKNQKSIAALLLDKSGLEKEFNVFNNSGLSSSIFNLADNHGFEKLNLQVSEIKLLKSSTIDELFASMNLNAYTHWVLDVQGSELLVLQGATKSLGYCRSMTVEVSTREVYRGGVSYNNLKDYLGNHGFYPLWEPELDHHCEIIFLKNLSNN
jgi:FkbM family methyltransferase